MKADDKWTNYIDAGYDPDDGLDSGRWMRDAWGVVRWVRTQEGEFKPCPDCPKLISRRALRCPTCARRRRRNIQAQESATGLIACPDCMAAIGQHCFTSTGRHRAPHATRLVGRSCPCGTPLDKAKKVCQACRAKARRENGRKGMQNTRARRRDEAA